MNNRERPILFSSPMVRAILAGRKTQTRRVIDERRLHVRVPRMVRSEPELYLAGLGRDAHAGRYRCTMNQHGAVTLLLPNQERLGVKPGEFHFECPYADGETYLEGERIGDRQTWTIAPTASRLWVRETWAQSPAGPVAYRADYDPAEALCGPFSHIYDTTTQWRPSIFMRRHLSRLTLEVTGVRVERLQDISADDVVAEGIDPAPHRCGCEVCTMASTTCPASASSLVLAFGEGWDTLNGKRAPWASNPWVWVVSFRRVEAKERAA